MLLLPEWTTSKKPSAFWQDFLPNTDPGNLCQASCTICWAWVSEGKKNRQLEPSALKCHFLGKYEDSHQKAAKQSILPVHEGDRLNMVAFLMKNFSLQILSPLFNLSQTPSEGRLCDATWKIHEQRLFMWECSKKLTGNNYNWTVSSWSKGLEAEHPKNCLILL